MVYSLGTRCLAEFIGMAVVIYTGEAALANELLPNTKGHAMGWGWTVFTFGFAFFAPLQAFAKVSAKLNPAMCLAQWIWGNLTGIDFVCLSLAELAGAFVGAVLHWIHFLPHYKTLPEPPAADRDDGLLRRRDHLRESALAIASYATKPDRMMKSNPLSSLRNTLYYLSPSSVIHEDDAEELIAEYYDSTDPIRRRHSHTRKSAVDVNPLARRTIQVADLHRHLQEAHVERTLRHRTCPKCTASGDGSGSHNHGGNRLTHSLSSDPDALLAGSSFVDSKAGAASSNGGSAHDSSHRAASAVTGASRQQAPDDCRLVLDAQPPGSPSKARAAGLGSKKPLEALYPADEVAAHKQRAQALYNAAVVADQNAKLSIFATRPAIYAPVYNFITEVMGTTALILLALLIELQARRFPEGSDAKLFYEVGLQNLLICFTVFVCIAGLGGPTAYAANPARDLGPRIAHALLPIPGKGSSEWQYAWVPFFAPLVGGAFAGLLYMAIEEMQFPGSGAKRGGGLFVG